MTPHAPLGRVTAQRKCVTNGLPRCDHRGLPLASGTTDGGRIIGIGLMFTGIGFVAVPTAAQPTDSCGVGERKSRREKDDAPSRIERTGTTRQ